jgi:hypothetical protein
MGQHFTHSGSSIGPRTNAGWQHEQKAQEHDRTARHYAAAGDEWAAAFYRQKAQAERANGRSADAGAQALAALMNEEAAR